MLKMTKKGMSALIFVALCIIASVALQPEINLPIKQAQATAHSPTDKIESKLWSKIQELKAGETTENMTLIIWLEEDQIITNMSIDDLKTHAVSVLANNHGADVYRVCEVLPVIMVVVRVDEIESIATYDFVEHIYGSERAYLALDVSKRVIRAEGYSTEICGYDGSGLNIAIIDSGINRFHPDLDDLDDNPATNDPKVTQEISFVDWDNDSNPDVGPMDNLGHGTLVAGIAAGTGEASGYQYVGVAPGARLWNYKVFETRWWIWDWEVLRWVPVAYAQSDDIVTAIDHVIAQGADIINLSFRVEIGGNGTNVVSRAADRAAKRGIVVVAAAGNDGQYGSQTIGAPGDAFDVITVGAIDDRNTQNIGDDIVASFSSIGPTGDGRTKPDVMAPGVNIIAPIDQASDIGVTYPELRVGNFYFEACGTSMAAPHVAGMAALILQAHPNWTPAMVKHAIRETANLNDVLQSLTENDRGKGIVDAVRAVSYGTEIPANQAESKYENYWGNAHAIAYYNGTIKLWAAGTGAGDARAEARLNKTFTPSCDVSNPIFFFGFHDVGKMEADLGGAELYATLKLWQGNTLLASTQNQIHFINWMSAYVANDSHTIQLTYQGSLLAGQQYKLEYGFWTFAYLGWSNFYDIYGSSSGITALHLTVIGTMGVRNPSFEERGKSVTSVPYWWSNNVGWRNVRGDLGGGPPPQWGLFDGYCNAPDYALFLQAYKGEYWGPYRWYADFTGDGKIDSWDSAIFIQSYRFDISNHLEDGLYSWYTNGGGDYTISQWLCDLDVNAMKDHEIQLGFYFKPETVAFNGSMNNARAEIYCVLDDGTTQTINGDWTCPTQVTWYNPCVTAMIPANTIAIKIIIRGTPNFKAWIDKASIIIM